MSEVAQTVWCKQGWPIEDYYNVLEAIRRLEKDAHKAVQQPTVTVASTLRSVYNELQDAPRARVTYDFAYMYVRAAAFVIADLMGDDWRIYSDRRDYRKERKTRRG